MQKELTREIDLFLNISIPHSLKRLLAADLKTLYIGLDQVHNKSDLDYFTINYENLKVDPIKGGYQLKQYLTYNW